MRKKTAIHDRHTINQKSKIKKWRKRLMDRRSAQECARIVDSIRGFPLDVKRRIVQAANILVG